MNAWGLTDKGVIRAQNQDAFFLQVLHEDNLALLVVCDGMGGARAGDVASKLAMETFVGEVRGNLRPGINVAQMKQILLISANKANEAVYAQATTGGSFAGMGTTLVGALMSGFQAVVANVGDSRAYRVSSSGITRVTRDHSLVEDLIEKGDITLEEARFHPSRNLITRALGTDPWVDCDLFDFVMDPGDFLLLCSDGLTNVVDEQEILYEVLHGGEPARACAQLLELAYARGGPDNITIALVSL